MSDKQDEKLSSNEKPRCRVLQCNHQCQTFYFLEMTGKYVCDDCCRELGRLIDKMLAERN